MAKPLRLVSSFRAEVEQDNVTSWLPGNKQTRKLEPTDVNAAAFSILESGVPRLITAPFSHLHGRFSSTSSPGGGFSALLITQFTPWRLTWVTPTWWVMAVAKLLKKLPMHCRTFFGDVHWLHWRHCPTFSHRMIGSSGQLLTHLACGAL